MIKTNAGFIDNDMTQEQRNQRRCKQLTSMSLYLDASSVLLSNGVAHMNDEVLNELTLKHRLRSEAHAALTPPPPSLQVGREDATKAI